MRCFFLFSLALILFATRSPAQERCNLTIQIDSAIDKDRLNIHFLDGINVFFMRDSLKTNVLRIDYPFYSKYGEMQIIDQVKNKTYRFFVNNRYGRIYMSTDGHKDSLLRVEYNENVVNIEETEVGKAYIQFAPNLTENKAISELYSKYAKKENRDSIRVLLQQEFKSLHRHVMEFLRPHRNDYFAFWHFKNIITSSAFSFFEDEPEYFNELLSYMKETFPTEYLEKEEAIALVREMESFREPLAINMEIPPVVFNDIYGHTFGLKDLESQYVLIEFWATWCHPCMQKIPVIKQIRQKYNSKQLAIMSINSDKDSLLFANTIKEMAMDWIHVFEKNRYFSSIFGVRAIPHVLLIDKKGILRYRSTGGIDLAKIDEIVRGRN